jgi:hypothetical protein
MKNTPVSIKSALVNDLAQPYLILDMEFTGNTIRLTNLPYNIVVDNNTYIADGGLTELEPPKLTSILDREVYQIKLVDFNNEFKNYFENNALGSKVTVRLGITGNTDDFDIVYRGRIDGTSITTNPSEGSKDAIIECSSPFAALDRTNNRMTDKTYQRNINENDSSMDFVYSAAKEVELKWGKV